MKRQPKGDRKRNTREEARKIGHDCVKIRGLLSCWSLGHSILQMNLVIYKDSRRKKVPSPHLLEAKQNDSHPKGPGPEPGRF